MVSASKFLPRVGFYPIFSEGNLVNAAVTVAEMPLTIQKDFPLKGKSAPDFILSDQHGQKCRLQDTLKLGRPIILFFFPLAGSPHCTRQTCLLRDALQLTPIFDVMQAIVIGISQDSPKRARKFAKEHQLSYPILHDYKRTVMQMYGVGKSMFGLVDTRATFVIDPSGIVRGLAEAVWNSKGHLRFAAQWLIQLEKELSALSKQYNEYTLQDGDMIANMQQLQDRSSDKVMQIIYGYQDRTSDETHGSTALTGLQTGKDFAEDIDRSADRDQQKNKWKNWKVLFSQLSSSRRYVTAPQTQAKDTSKSPDIGKDSMQQIALTSTPSVSLPKAKAASEEIKTQVKSDEAAAVAATSPTTPPEVTSTTKATKIFTRPRPRPHPITSTSSCGIKDQNLWMLPLNAAVKSAGWEVDKITDHPVTPSTPKRISSNHSRLGSLSSYDVSQKTTTTANPLVAAIQDDATASSDNQSQQLETPGVESEVLKKDVPRTMEKETVKDISSPLLFSAASTSPLLSSLPLPPVQQNSNDDSRAVVSNDSQLESYKQHREKATITVPNRPFIDMFKANKYRREQDVLDLLNSFPKTPNSVGAKKKSSNGLTVSGKQRSASYDSHTYHSLKKSKSDVDLITKRKQKTSSLDSGHEELPVRLSESPIDSDSDVTVSGKHTSFDHYHQYHHHNINEGEVLQRPISFLSQISKSKSSEDNCRRYPIIRRSRSEVPIAQRKVKPLKELPSIPKVVTANTDVNFVNPFAQMQDTNSLLLKSFLINENSTSQEIKNHQTLMMVAMLLQLGSNPTPPPQDTALDLD